MLEDGLIVKPKYDDVEYYLKEGQMTKITEDIQEIASMIKQGNMSDDMIIRNILAFMNRNIVRLRHANTDNRKFRRTAQEILESKERTGCSDSATLFRTLAIACGIPTIQIIAMNKEKYKSSGHFYSGVFLNDTQGNKKWHILDSDQSASNVEDVRLSLKQDIYDRNIGKDYTFAYTLDYRDVVLNGETIDSIKSINSISSIVYGMCNKKDMKDIDCR